MMGCSRSALSPSTRYALTPARTAAWIVSSSLRSANITTGRGWPRVMSRIDSSVPRSGEIHIDQNDVRLVPLDTLQQILIASHAGHHLAALIPQGLLQQGGAPAVLVHHHHPQSFHQLLQSGRLRPGAVASGMPRRVGRRRWEEAVGQSATDTVRSSLHPRDLKQCGFKRLDGDGDGMVRGNLSIRHAPAHWDRNSESKGSPPRRGRPRL